MKLPRVSLFTLVYLCIAAATASHTSWGAATVMQGAAPDEGMALLAWWLQGLAFAVAVDVSMLAISTRIRNGERATLYIVAFTVVAIASAYTQLLYGWAHTADFTHSPGVPAEWVTRLQWLVDLRIVALPLLLPVISVLYTAAGLGHTSTHPAAQPAPAMPDEPRRIVVEHTHVTSAPEAPPPAMQAPPARERLPLAINTRKLPSGASGRAKTGELDNAVTERDGGYVATCPRCDREFSKPTRDAARNSLTAHLRSHVQVLEDA